jgi:glycosyltransferase involved in cell wall biosynthesis
MPKKRILLVNDASYLKTGYGVYGHELMTRLAATNKYELCELGCYAEKDNPNIRSVKWGFIPNIPTEQHHVKEYQSNRANEWGAWKFEESCVFFQPDVVITFRDFWMDEFINRSPYRRLFSYITMPTVDSVPQQPLWLSNYLKCDRILTYTEWGRDVLERQTNGKLKVWDIAPPAANPKDFYPVQDKKAHKEKMGIDPDAFIIGTVMRNQARKLYQDLFHSFAATLDSLSAKNRENTYLYCHVAYPDLFHDIPELIRDCGVGRNILFTYTCRNCKRVFPSFFRDAKTYCQCGAFAAELPRADHNLSGKTMGEIMNCFDVYVQYSTNEGFGMPLVEAAFCDVPVIGVRYSAMESILQNINGIAIEPLRFNQDTSLKVYRALPDNAELSLELKDIIEKNDTEWGKTVGKLARAKYSYDETAKIWQSHIDDMPIKNQWKSPPNLLELSHPKPPFNLNNYQFVEWCVMYILKDRSFMDDYMVTRVIKNLNYGRRTDLRLDLGMNDQGLGHNINLPYSKQDAIKEFLVMAEKNNLWEQHRWNTLAT